ncbi:MAG: hypothetical protein ASARMPRED_008375 [Alectoria sarmentosa]|nr:MAG: hypothetical protein ASARMPRED_008375 [Alectoria sarmentosa]
MCVTMVSFFYIVLSSLLSAAPLVFASPAQLLFSDTGLSSTSNVARANNNVGASPVDCNATRFGDNLTWESSLNALAKVSQDPALRTFEMRDPGEEEPGWVVILPLRILSDDGNGFIDIATKNDELVSETCSWREIRQAANSIIQTCLSQPVAQGGVEGLLTVTVSSYDSSSIRCIDPTATMPVVVPPYGSCNSILEAMPWDERAMTFGDRPSPIGALVVLLPKTFRSPDNQCVLRIAMNAPGYEITSWSNIWAATVAIQEMCVKQGKIGASKINGMTQDWLDDFNTAELGKRLHTADIGVSSGGTYKISIALVKDSRSTPAASNIANLTLNTAGGNVTIL